jgi:hypothetical protein
MTEGLRALLAGAIDYAGLFPPANLPLAEAVGNFARYRQGPEAWMLGHFVLPAARLAELEPLADEAFRPGPPFPIAALGRGGDTVAGWLAGLEADLEDVARFLGRHGRRVRVDVLETRLPGEVVRAPTPEGVADCVGPAATLIDKRQFPVLAPFYEAPLGGEWRAAVATVLAGLACDHELAAVGRHLFCRPAGFKLRCGGLTAGAFPSPEQVAATVRAAREARVPLKLTAGLHHPLPHYDPAMKATMHGFLNVLVAGVLASAHDPPETTLRDLLEDADPPSFVFDDRGLAWKGLHATSAEVGDGRREVVTSFGSCSFDEPRDDLHGLGWL